MKNDGDLKTNWAAKPDNQFDERMLKSKHLAKDEVFNQSSSLKWLLTLIIFADGSRCNNWRR